MHSGSRGDIRISNTVPEIGDTVFKAVSDNDIRNISRDRFRIKSSGCHQRHSLSHATQPKAFVELTKGRPPHADKLRRKHTKNHVRRIDSVAFVLVLRSIILERSMPLRC